MDARVVLEPLDISVEEDDRTALTKEALQRSFLDNLFFIQGKFPALASQNDYYMALAFTVRDRMLQRWISTAAEYTKQGSRTVAYLSAEFLTGQHLGNNLLNLGCFEHVRAAISELGLDFDALLQREEEPGLGNGGLGRLAACFLDSLATLELPALGYGIRYEYGIFEQKIVDGWQVEQTDLWLRYGNPWEIPRPEWAVEVRFGGHTEHRCDEQGQLHVRWIPHHIVCGVPYDTPILGYRVNTANTLRLWRAEAPESFDFAVFNRGDYYGAVNHKVASENLTKILYPNDEPAQGKELRLEQQYFFVSCSLQDMLRILRVQHIPLERFHEKFVVQLNDTHPAIAVAELMRLLIDEHALPWEKAWSITRKTFAYTNHTLMPEALERWPVALFARVLPRHYEIILEINARFLDEARIRYFGDEGRIARLSIIDESGERYVRMAHLACVGSRAINGVAELHTQLLRQSVLHDFHHLWPEKISNKTNGVTPRRWLQLSNPQLAELVSRKIGNGWTTDLKQLSRLAPFAADGVFRADWRAIKHANKRRLAALVRAKTGVAIDPDSLFDVQVKRIHEYKRQHLNVLRIVGLYQRLKSQPGLEVQPRTFIFAGKAAPGYRLAKLIIKLIHCVADVINRDADVSDLMKVVFIPNLSVSTAQIIYPAADLSEQISTAGTEASGTSNMKFALNGAVTIGTLDGANIEIREEVGADNFFSFGLSTAEIARLRTAGYQPRAYFHANDELRAVIEVLRSGFFSRGDTELFQPLLDSLLDCDPYLVMADHQAYVEAQDRVDRAWRDPDTWTRRSIVNSASSGRFSSDRTVREYCEDIWRINPVRIRLLSQQDVKAGLMQ